MGRFAQADTVIPGGVQGLDRYASMGNNPVRYIDPSGHNEQCAIGEHNCRAGVLVDDVVSPPPPTPTPTQTTSPSTPTIPLPINNNSIPTSSCTHIPCQPTATPTSTPTLTPTSTPWKPVGQQTGENVANWLVDVAIPFCFGPADMSGATGCGELIAGGVSAAVTYFTGAPPADAEVYGKAFDQAVGWFHIFSDVNIESTPFSYTPNPYTPTSSPTITPTPLSVISTPTSYYSTPTVIMPSSTPTIYWIPR